MKRFHLLATPVNTSQIQNPSTLKSRATVQYLKYFGREEQCLILVSVNL